jgi:hypothetical protein
MIKQLQRNDYNRMQGLSHGLPYGRENCIQLIGVGLYKDNPFWTLF